MIRLPKEESQVLLANLEPQLPEEPRNQRLQHHNLLLEARMMLASLVNQELAVKELKKKSKRRLLSKKRWKPLWNLRDKELPTASCRSTTMDSKCSEESGRCPLT